MDGFIQNLTNNSNSIILSYFLKDFSLYLILETLYFLEGFVFYYLHVQEHTSYVLLILLTLFILSQYATFDRDCILHKNSTSLNTAIFFPRHKSPNTIHTENLNESCTILY